MKVFISWSKERSLFVAKALEEWLPQVINQVQPWMSAKSIESGKLSIAQISEALESTNFGIICVTPENQRETWLNFEAGALSKAVKGANASAIPLLVGFDDIGSLGAPLSNYQAHLATKEDLKVIVHAINNALPTKRDAIQLDVAFDKWWPDLEIVIKEAEAWSAPATVETKASQEQKVEQSLEEILQSVKTLMLQFSDLASRTQRNEQLTIERNFLLGEALAGNFSSDEHVRHGFVQKYEPPIPETIMNTISRYLVSQDRLWGSAVSIEEGGLIRVTTPVPLTEEERSSIGVSIFGSRKVEGRIVFDIDPHVGGK